MKIVSAWITSLFKDSASPAALIGVWTLLLGGFGILLAYFTSGVVASELQFSAFGSMALTCLAAWMVGGFIGFLFGIPRVLQGNEQVDSASAAKRRYEQRVNTNLEQISDWLTKIIVGVGLVEMKEAPEFVWTVATKLSHSYTATGSPNAAIVPIICSSILFFAVLGILFGYLITRLYLAGAFQDADQQADRERGAGSSTIEVSNIPIEPIKPVINTSTDQQFSDAAKRILATLAKYQKEHCGTDQNKRWTFVVLPGSPAYSEYLKAVSELLEAGKVLVSPETNHVMLSSEGLKHVEDDAETLKGITPIAFQ